MDIPSPKVNWLRNRDTIVLCSEIAKAIGALVLVWINAPKLAADGRLAAAVGTTAAGAAVFLGSAVGAFTGWQDRRKKKSLHDLEGCLHTLHAVLHAASEDDPNENDPGVRVAIHVPRQRGELVELEQVCDYICREPGRCTGKGRRFSPNTGLIGEVYRTQKVGVVHRTDDSYEAFIDQMMTRWGYTLNQAKKLDATVMSYMAAPLMSPERGVEAIVYVDARRRNFFSRTRQDLVETAGPGIALYIWRRYNQ